MIRKLVLFTCIFSGFLISGCTHLVTPPTPVAQSSFQKESWDQREQRLNALVQWKVRGAFSFNDHSDKVRMASYTWDQYGQTYTIYIHAALNLYGAVIKGAPGSVQLYRGSNKPVTADSPEDLMQSQLGYSLPISDLQYWIRGLPAISKHSATYDQWGHISTLKQDGWTVHFDRYRPISNEPFNNVDVPRFLDLSNGHIDLRIVANNWNGY